MANYYNEIEPFKAEWLRELMKAGLIAPGEVDERSIEQVEAAGLRDFTQCHFFAGIGVWSYALRLAGWPDDRPVWTGSCPCPSFSAAGKGKGFDDPRHLWPTWFGLIRQCRPATVFGEQVDAAIGHGWLDLVQSDLEGEAYSVGKAVLGACSVGAPHIRKRLYFVAESDRAGAGRLGADPTGSVAAPSSDGFMEHADRRRCENGWTEGSQEMGEPLGDGSRAANIRSAAPQSESSLTNGFWRDAEWLWCKDGKYRPTKPGLFPLAHGTPRRVGRLRGYGDAMVAPVAQAFIEAYIESRELKG